MSEIWTVRRVLAWTAQHFEKHEIDSPRLTAEVLLAHVLGRDRVGLYVDLDRPLDRTELATFRGLLARRAAGEPTQYLTGRRDFYGRPILVDPRVLIPRPETELLVEAVLAALPAGTAKIVDACTGSGCIAVTLASERPEVTVWATDSSSEACAVATDNAQALGVGERVRVLQGDLLAPVAAEAPFDAVVSNPPYVRSAEIDALSREVRREPRSALDGGADGLDVLRRLASGARRLLAPGGLLAVEISETQGESVRTLLEREGFVEVRVAKDLARLDRLAFGRQPAVG